ncbi:RcnB family protein [Paracoccus sp. TK19116]|uniref:RcnB family protein n=1 Tax=Paracoccus albicereus TaxID=2922394 RepID=A0ABT1MW32_9RHOB|nr:RcnB family protein [Paracoccus albicereus]MCQ0971706.1 RcnB family protein [Paracoccus albicereus]
MTMLQHALAASLALTTAIAPMAATAQGNGHGKGQAHAKAKTAHAGNHSAIGQNNLVARQIRVDATRCPPGLAKKSPVCVPPGQARKHGIAVGDVLDWGNIHVVTDPGLYGLSSPPRGSRYGVVDGQLVRLDERTGRILSIIRLVEAILD